MSTEPKTFLTPEQYLEAERKAESKSEYCNGEMFPMDRAGLDTTDMAGAREIHGDLIWNFGGGLRGQLRSGNCRGISNEMRVLVSATGLYTCPDTVVACGQRVLSRSTEAYGRGRKFEQYRSMPSLRQCVPVSSDRMNVDWFTRQPGAPWLCASVGKPEELITLDSIGCRVRLADLYEGVELA